MIRSEKMQQKIEKKKARRAPRQFLSPYHCAADAATASEARTEKRIFFFLYLVRNARAERGRRKKNRVNFFRFAGGDESLRRRVGALSERCTLQMRVSAEHLPGKSQLDLCTDLH